MNTSIPINTSPNDKTICFASGKCYVDIWQPANLTKVKNFSFRTGRIYLTGHFHHNEDSQLWLMAGAALDLKGYEKGLLKINAKSFFDAMIEWNKHEYKNSKHIVMDDSNNTDRLFLFWTRNKEQKNNAFSYFK